VSEDWNYKAVSSLRRRLNDPLRPNATVAALIGLILFRLVGGVGIAGKSAKSALVGGRASVIVLTDGFRLERQRSGGGMSSSSSSNCVFRERHTHARPRVECRRQSTRCTCKTKRGATFKYKCNSAEKDRFCVKIKTKQIRAATVPRTTPRHALAIRPSVTGANV